MDPLGYLHLSPDEAIGLDFMLSSLEDTTCFPHGFWLFILKLPLINGRFMEKYLKPNKNMFHAPKV